MLGDKEHTPRDASPEPAWPGTRPIAFNRQNPRGRAVLIPKPAGQDLTPQGVGCRVCRSPGSEAFGVVHSAAGCDWGAQARPGHREPKWGAGGLPQQQSTPAPHAFVPTCTRTPHAHAPTSAQPHPHPHTPAFSRHTCTAQVKLGSRDRAPVTQQRMRACMKWEVRPTAPCAHAPRNVPGE